MGNMALIATKSMLEKIGQQGPYHNQIYARKNWPQGPYHKQIYARKNWPTGTLLKPNLC